VVAVRLLLEQLQRGTAATVALAPRLQFLVVL
jgi:hypothetical protein